MTVFVALNGTRYEVEMDYYAGSPSRFCDDGPEAEVLSVCSESISCSVDSFLSALAEDRGLSVDDHAELHSELIALAEDELAVLMAR